MLPLSCRVSRCGGSVWRRYAAIPACHKGHVSVSTVLLQWPPPPHLQAWATRGAATTRRRPTVSTEETVTSYMVLTSRPASKLAVRLIPRPLGHHCGLGCSSYHWSFLFCSRIRAPAAHSLCVFNQGLCVCLCAERSILTQIPGSSFFRLCSALLHWLLVTFVPWTPAARPDLGSRVSQHHYNHPNHSSFSGRPVHLIQLVGAHLGSYWVTFARLSTCPVTILQPLLWMNILAGRHGGAVLPASAGSLQALVVLPGVSMFSTCLWSFHVLGETEDVLNHCTTTESGMLHLVSDVYKWCFSTSRVLRRLHWTQDNSVSQSVGLLSCFKWGYLEFTVYFRPADVSSIFPLSQS